MKTLVPLLFAMGCAAPVAPVQPPAATPVPMAEPIGRHDSQLASWTPSGPAMAVAAARPERCSLRVTAKGAMVDGDTFEVDDAIAICASRSAVLVEMADDADPAIWTRLDAAFAAAKIPVLLRGHRGDITCDVNPLAKTCL